RGAAEEDRDPARPSGRAIRRVRDPARLRRRLWARLRREVPEPPVHRDAEARGVRRDLVIAGNRLMRRARPRAVRIRSIPLLAIAFSLTFVACGKDDQPDAFSAGVIDGVVLLGP